MVGSVVWAIWTPPAIGKFRLKMPTHARAECGRACLGMYSPLKIVPSLASHSHLIHASIGPLESSTQTVSQSIQPFLHSSWQSVPILYNELPFPLKIAASHGGIWTSYNMHDFLGPSEPTTQMTSLLFHSFLHRRPQSVPILYSGPTLSPP